MKSNKTTATKATKANKTQAQSPRQYNTLFRPVADIVATAVEPKEGTGATRYTLDEGGAFVLAICFTDKDYDFGSLTVLGLSVNVTVRATKDGAMFLSFPSVKNKNGDYVDLVRMFDKDFHTCVKALLSAIYSEQEELPFD